MKYVGSKAASYTAVALSLLTWRIRRAASNASNFKMYYLVTGDRGSCATKQKLAGSIPDGVTGIFH